MVTVNQTTVLTATVISITYDCTSGLPAGRRDLTTARAVTDTTNEAIMALISLQALMRHQYHRRMSTRPVPEPSARSSSHIAPTVSICEVTTIDSRNRITVDHRDTET